MVAAFSPALLTTLGGVGLALGGFRWWPLTLLTVGLGLAAVVVVDYPIQVVFGPEGIDRRCLGRTERLAWDEVTRVVRPAYASLLGRFRLGRDSTGLVAERRGRRYLLTDKMESRAENEALLDGLFVWAPGTPVEATRPPDSTPPTWLYKRRRGDGDGLVDEL